MLNAFRHHRKTHTSWLKTNQPTTRVLNAFRHHRKTHCGIQRAEVHPLFSCSTPFGIIGRLTAPLLNTDLRFLVCSTPFGIIGRLTSSPCATSAAKTCAQRLSASSEDSPAGNSSVPSFSLCSTPFGIIGRLTAYSSGPKTNKACAQRLSASSEDSLGTFEVT